MDPIKCMAAVDIGARDPRTLFERAGGKGNPAEVERTKREQTARTTAERIEALRHTLFSDSERNTVTIEDLTNGLDAVQLLISAHERADVRLVLGILRVAIGNRWGDVVNAGVHCFEPPVAASIQELWNLTTSRAAA